MKKSASKFLLVGVGAFLIDYLLTLLLHYLFGISGYAASAIGFSTGFVFSFTLSRRWVFRRKASYTFSTKRQIVMYLVLAGLNLAVTTVIIGYLTTISVDLYASKIFVTGLVACWNYLISHYLIFREDKD